MANARNAVQPSGPSQLSLYNNFDFEPELLHSLALEAQSFGRLQLLLEPLVGVTHLGAAETKKQTNEVQPSGLPGQDVNPGSLIFKAENSSAIVAQ